MITIDQARLYYEGADAAHDFEHVLRVLRLVERIGPSEGADMEVLRAAALLHDVARSAEHSGGPCHAQAGAERAREILHGQDPARVEAVAAAIAAHRFRGGRPPESVEARVLFDADKLDAMGAIGIARAYAVAGLMGQKLWGEVPAGFGARERDEAKADFAAAEHTPVHEYAFKLSRLQSILFTPTARRIGQERDAFMRAFFARLEREVRGEA